MSGRRLFGVETEYAVTALDGTGTVFPPGEVGGALVRAAIRTLPCLPGTLDGGLFLANGSRLYVDAGDHPELAGPECLDPWDAVRYARAGDLILLGLAEEVRRRNPTVAHLRVFAGNVDYSQGSEATWGAHESYCHRADPGVLGRRLIPHLVSRLIYSGAGGFDPFSHGIAFTLSPRAHHLTRVISDQSTRDRGIVHTRDEPLGRHGYRRQHLLCGESLRSDLGTWLKVGATALVVAMIEGGVACGDDVELTAPMDALRTVARDVSCRRRVQTTRGAMSAIEIERRYLQHALAHRHAPFMPPWAETVCTRWADALERLAQAPDRMSASLDWAIKLAIYRDRAGRRGFEWPSLAAWTLAVEMLERMRRHDEGPRPPLSAALVRRGALQARAAGLAPLLASHGLEWDRLDAFLALRAELFEVDVRWGQLGPEGVFEQLDRAGVLDHRVAGVDRLDEAVESPPAAGRAHARGLAIRERRGERRRFTCGWDHVLERETGRLLDLSDPFAEVERWIAPPVARPRDGNPRLDARRTPDRPRWGGIGRVFARVRPAVARTRPAD